MKIFLEVVVVCLLNELYPMFVDTSKKKLIPTPLIRNIICHNNLLLLGKTKYE